MTTFESLSDELLIHLFRYFNTQDIFQYFYNLNIRLNTLIKSLNNLHLTISSTNDFISINPLFPYISSLIIIDEIDINLEQFSNLHRLIIYSSSNKFLNQFQINILSNLEYLFIPNILFGMSPIFEKIFSNKYSHLKFCHLFGFETIETIGKWTQIISLRILKIGLIDFYVYKAILSSCPNLYYFKLEMFQSYLKLSNIQTHINLRKLEIHSEINDWRYNDQLIDSFLSCVINLEQLSIYRSISFSKLLDFIPDYDWFASIIAIRLPFLKYLIVCLQLEYHSEFIDSISTETRRELRKFFLKAHQNRYQSRFIIK